MNFQAKFMNYNDLSRISYSSSNKQRDNNKINTNNKLFAHAPEPLKILAGHMCTPTDTNYVPIDHKSITNTQINANLNNQE